MGQWEIALTCGCFDQSLQLYLPPTFGTTCNENGDSLSIPWHCVRCHEKPKLFFAPATSGANSSLDEQTGAEPNEGRDDA